MMFQFNFKCTSDSWTFSTRVWSHRTVSWEPVPHWPLMGVSLPAVTLCHVFARFTVWTGNAYPRGSGRRIETHWDPGKPPSVKCGIEKHMIIIIMGPRAAAIRDFLHMREMNTDVESVDDIIEYLCTYWSIDVTIVSYDANKYVYIEFYRLAFVPGRHQARAPMNTMAHARVPTSLEMRRSGCDCTRLYERMNNL